jgi:hypothetical protein
MNLQNLVDEHVLVLIPRIHESQYQKVKLHGVEAGGIWIESQNITNAILQSVGSQVAPKTPIFFFPYHQISFVIGRLDVPALDEKAFGV